MTVKRIEKGNEEVKLNSDVHNLPLYIQCTVLATLTYHDVHNLPLIYSVQCWIR